jgi:hypothetical protein
VNGVEGLEVVFNCSLPWTHWVGLSFTSQAVPLQLGADGAVLQGSYLKHTRIIRALTGVSVTVNAPLFDHVSIENPQSMGIYATSLTGKFVMKSCQLTNVPYWAVFIESFYYAFPVVVDISDSSISQAGYGIYLNNPPSSSVFFVNSTVVNVEYAYALYVYSPSWSQTHLDVTVSFCSLVSQGYYSLFLSLAYPSTVTVYGNTITNYGNDFAAYASFVSNCIVNGTVVISNNQFVRTVGTALSVTITAYTSCAESVSLATTISDNSFLHNVVWGPLVYINNMGDFCKLEIARNQFRNNSAQYLLQHETSAWDVAPPVAVTFADNVFESNMQTGTIQ